MSGKTALCLKLLGGFPQMRSALASLEQTTTTYIYK